MALIIKKNSLKFSQKSQQYVIEYITNHIVNIRDVTTKKYPIIIITTLPKLIWEQAASPPLMADPLIVAVYGSPELILGMYQILPLQLQKRLSYKESEFVF